VNPWIGWALAVLAIAFGYTLYGWQGVLLGVTMVVFWLLLQFSRLLRVMRGAAQAPVGHVASAVMLNAKLHEGQRLVDIIQLTHSLGLRVSEEPEVWCWRDDSGASVSVTFANGRVRSWSLERPPQADS
jgi:hypothetical protein